MAVRARDAGNAQRLIKGLKLRDAGNVIRTVKAGKIRDAGNVLRTFFSFSNLVVTPVTDELSATKSTTGAGKTVSVMNPPLTVVGGVAPLTVAWTRVSGDTRIGVDNAAISNPTFSASLSPDDEAAGTWKGVVSDSAGASQTVTRTITLQLIFTDISGTA